MLQQNNTHIPEENGMKVKMKIKIFIDILMEAFLLLLMSVQVTGELLHEWFGVGMLLLFIVHNLMNIRWYVNLGKGRYKLIRILRTVVNFAAFVAMLSIGFSGILMSRHIFAFLPISNGMALARVMHLAGSYWGFVLMSIHLGLHWGMAVSMFGKIKKTPEKRNNQVCVWGFRLLAFMIAGYGLLCFIWADIPSYMFLDAEFAFFDFEKSDSLYL
jgi:hypothetical protein